MRLFVLLFLILSVKVYAQPKVLQGNTPSWVTQYDYAENISDTTETSNGYAYLLISRQSHLENKETYWKFVMKVTGEDGLSVVSSINESFDPSFQKLTFHELNIIRNGKKINKLDPAKFDVLQREEEMERAIYDKSVNAVYNLPDVRVGDIVEYSLTRRGTNPVFNGHSFGAFYLQYGTPVSKFAYKFVYSPKRQLQFKNFGDIGTMPTETLSGALKVSEWIRENVPALLTDDQLPSWYDAYPHVQYSDFASWNEVKAWAYELYRMPQLKNGELKDVLESVKSSEKRDDEKIKECIRIAQGDIRYLSFSDGVNGYRPHAPDAVYAQKYGDCKDKSFMLALMLNNLGIKSSPALVATDNGYSLPKELPNPYAFNHCIVQFTYKDSTYWIDPTLNAQVGPLKTYCFPTYHHALVIDNEASELTAIPFGYKNSMIDVKEDYSMDEVGGYVKLKVTTTYYGDEADEIRSYFKSNTTEEINKTYLNFYAKDFSEISVAKDVAYEDDPVSNIITSSEEYLVKNFWTLENGNKTATIYARVLAGYLNKPDTRVRTMPLAVTHPRNILQTIKIHLPEEWNIEDSRTEIESDAFIYKRSRFYADKTITMRYQYKTKASFVEGDRSDDHIDKIEQALDDNGFTIYKEPGTTSNRSTHSYVLLVVVVIVVLYAVKKRRG